MEYMKWKDVLTQEGVKNLYPMHYRPNKEKTYSVFLIVNDPWSKNTGEDGREIQYTGTAVPKWINDNFYSLANCRISSETIKVYYKDSPDRWIPKGFYKLAGGSIKGDDYRFKLVPVRGSAF